MIAILFCFADVLSRSVGVILGYDFNFCFILPVDIERIKKMMNDRYIMSGDGVTLLYFLYIHTYFASLPRFHHCSLSHLTVSKY